MMTTGKARHRMTHNQKVAEADDLTGLVAHLIPGYAELPPGGDGDDLALLERWKQSVTTANLVQALLVAAAVDEESLDLSEHGEDFLTPLFSDRIEPVEVDVWSSSVVPLVLVSTSYAPFTDQTPPTGHVRWVNPHTERTYLDSLNALGVIELSISEADSGDDT